MNAQMLLQSFAGGDGDGGENAYIEDVFSTYLYTGNSSTQTINNGIDLAGKGGMVWLKNRNTTGNNHIIYDTERGAGKFIFTNLLNAQATNLSGYDLTGFTSSGFSLGTPQNSGINESGNSNVSWTFRKAKKFFDVVTYTGDGVAGRQIQHSLGIAPGMIIIKRLNATGNCAVYYGDNTRVMYLNALDPGAQSAAYWNNTSPTSTQFTVGIGSTGNLAGATYIAYLFAHDPSPRGLIQCGIFTTDSSGKAAVTLGWEPQYVFSKAITIAGNWRVYDIMRGLTSSSEVANAEIRPNTSDAEMQIGPLNIVTSTGLNIVNAGASVTYFVTAIRKGPMRG